MTKNIELKPSTEKPLGKYLIEAGIVTSNQLKIALDEQRKTKKRLGEILSTRGWVKQKTIEYFVKQVILPERQAAKRKVFDGNSFQRISQLAAVNVYLFPQQIILFLLALVAIIISVCSLVRVTSYILPGYPLQTTLISLFDIDGDRTVPAFFSWSILLFCAFLLGAIAYSKKVARDRYTPQWIALASLFFYLHIDEAIGLHERIGLMVSGNFNPSGFFYYAWTIPGSIFVLFCLFIFLRFLNHLPTKIKYLFLLAGSIYVGGALIVEMYNGYYMSLYGAQSIYYSLSTIEESMEMLGIIIFIYGLLTYISSYMKGLQLRVIIPSQKTKLSHK